MAVETATSRVSALMTNALTALQQCCV